MDLMQEIIKKAEKLQKKIVFPEDEDDRVLEAVCRIAQRNIAMPVLIGNRDAIKKNINKACIKYKIEKDAAEKIMIIDNKDIDINSYAEKLSEIRREKGLDFEEAKKLLEDKMYVATMMLKLGVVDGVVSGAIHPTIHTLRPAFQIIKTAQGTSIASGVMLIIHEKGNYFFADCAVNPQPDEEQLAEIAITTAETVKLFGINPKVAMLSFSTRGSAKHPLAEKMRIATEIAKKKNPRLLVEGEIQLDSAVAPEVCKIKYPKSRIMGKANALIFPDLQCGNIGYKIAERFGNARAIGPIIQGLAKPVNDLSRGCSVEDIVELAAITALQAENAEK